MSTDLKIYTAKCINAEHAKELINDRLFAIDLHCHTAFSYDVPSVAETNPKNVLKTEHRKGLKPLVSDHDTLKGYNYLKHKGIKCIPAAEISIKPSKARKIEFSKPLQTLHINVFGLNNNDFTVLEDIAQKEKDLDAFMKYLRDNDLQWIYNHPFWHDKHERLNWKAIPGLAKNYFDVLELNATFSRGLNDLTLRLAARLNKGIVAGSDSHIGNPGVSMTIAEGKNFNAFWENVREHKMYVVRRDMGPLTVVREGATMLNQVFRAKRERYTEKKYRPSTGFKPFDKLASSVINGNLRDRYIIKKGIQMIAQSINYSAGPILAWRLHVSKEENFAADIHARIDAMTRKLRSVERDWHRQQIKKLEEKDCQKIQAQDHIE